jgi:hypothetical protein
VQRRDVPVKRIVLVILLFAVFALTFQGKGIPPFEAVVVYLAGEAEKDVGSGWIEVFVDDELAAHSQLRTGQDAVLDLSTSLGFLRRSSTRWSRSTR